MIFKNPFKKNKEQEKKLSTLDTIVEKNKNNTISRDQCKDEKEKWSSRLYNKLKGIFKTGNVEVKVLYDNECTKFEGKYKWIDHKTSVKDLEDTLKYLLEKTNYNTEKAAELAKNIRDSLFKKYGPSLNYFDVAYYIFKGIIKYDSEKGKIYIDGEVAKSLGTDSGAIYLKTRLLLGRDKYEDFIKKFKDYLQQGSYNQSKHKILYENKK